jgi:hypothetical protein
MAMANFFRIGSQQSLHGETIEIPANQLFSVGLFGLVQGLHVVSSDETAVAPVRTAAGTPAEPTVVPGGHKFAFRTLQAGKQADLRAEFSPPGPEDPNQPCARGTVWDSMTVKVVAAIAPIAFGAHVSFEFKQKLIQICGRLGIDPSHLMACMYNETAGTLSPSKWNPKHTAVGLLQFSGNSPKDLGTTLNDLASMSDVEQLDYVEKFFQWCKGRLKTVGDVYCAMFRADAIGKGPDFVLYAKTGDADGGKFPVDYYTANAPTFDLDGDGRITKAEVNQVAGGSLAVGRSSGHIG